MPDLAAPIDLLDPAWYAGDPTPMYRWLRTHDPVHWDPVNQLWGISRHADIVAIERDPATWSSAEGTRPMMNAEIATDSMIDLDNPRHAEQRAIVQDHFTRRAVAELEPVVRAKVDELIDRFAGRGEADLVEELAAPLPAELICAKLGFPEPMWRTLRVWGDEVNNLGDGVRFHTPDKIAALMAWREYAAGELAARQRCPTDDLLSRIVHTPLPSLGGCPMDPEAQLDEALLLLVGGSDTTRASISTAVWMLTHEHPDQWELLRAEPHRLRTAVEEIVRWTTPVLNMCRTATRDVDLHGRQIRRGQKVLLMYGSANRDESVFTEPDRFDVTRDPNPHLGFGFGPHLCLGINLAKMEIRVALERLLERLPDLRVRPGFVPAYNHTAFVRGFTSLEVVFSPHPASRRPG